MNKKLLVLAVSSALTGTSAFADTVNVNVYGKLWPQYETESGKGATVGPHPNITGLTLSGTDMVSHTSVNGVNSYVGFKGDVDVGGGMKGWFQVETNTRLDTGTGTWASRNSAAGLSGAFGNVFLGNWDTVYKQLGDPVSFLGVSSGNFVSVHSVLSNSSGVSGSSTASFHLRRANTVEYDTPTIGGFTALFAYSPDEGKTLATNADVRSLGVKWEAGPLYVAFANEEHGDMFAISRNTCAIGSSVSGSVAALTALANAACAANGSATITAGARSKDTANRFSVKYSLPTGTELGLDVAQMEYKETSAPGAATGKINKFKNKAYSLSATQKVASWQFAASYQKADKGTCELTGGGTCSTNGLGSTQMNLGAKYDFSKRTSVFALASKLKNEPGASRSLETAVSPGTDPEAAAVGIIVSF